VLRWEEKNDALRHALFLNKPAFIELAVTHGPDIASIPFLDVLMTGDWAIVAAFLEKGADPTADYFRTRIPSAAACENDARVLLGLPAEVDPTSRNSCRNRSTWR
jgi:hypothetical protein